MAQYSFLGRTAASIRLNRFQFCLRMGTELVPETLYSNELPRLCARENYIVAAKVLKLIVEWLLAVAKCHADASVTVFYTSIMS
jgi:hypothetical protein